MGIALNYGAKGVYGALTLGSQKKAPASPNLFETYAGSFASSLAFQDKGFRLILYYIYSFYYLFSYVGIMLPLLTLPKASIMGGIIYFITFAMWVSFFAWFILRSERIIVEKKPITPYAATPKTLKVAGQLLFFFFSYPKIAISWSGLYLLIYGYQVHNGYLISTGWYFFTVFLLLFLL